MNFLEVDRCYGIINTSDQSFSIQHQWNTPLSNKKVLNDDEWEVLTKGLDHLGKIAYDSGMKIVYHHHMTTTVQKTDEIDRMLAMTDPKYVSMIYDTGHLTFSGEDPIEILKKHHDRIGHVHLKNVRKPAMDKCYAENKSFSVRFRKVPPFPAIRHADFLTVFKLLDEQLRGLAGQRLSRIRYRKSARVRPHGPRLRQGAHRL